MVSSARACQRTRARNINVTPCKRDNKMHRVLIQGGSRPLVLRADDEDGTSHTG